MHNMHDVERNIVGVGTHCEMLFRKLVIRRLFYLIFQLWMHLQTEKSLFGDAFLLVNGLLDNSERFDDYLLHHILGKNDL